MYLCGFLWSVRLPPLTGTSVLAGIAIFSILGHMAHVYKRPIGKVVKEGQITTLQKKGTHFLVTLCGILWSLRRFRPCFHCVSRGFNPAARFPFMVRSLFRHAYRHQRGLPVHSDRWEGAETLPVWKADAPLGSLVLFWSIEVIITCISDSFPEVFETKRALITVTICAIIFLLALPCITQVRRSLPE